MLNFAWKFDYIPNITDVQSVRSYFIEHFQLPVELFERIQDLAEYWPPRLLCHVLSDPVYRARAWPTNQENFKFEADRLYALSEPIPQDMMSVGKVEFDIVGCDQGWIGNPGENETFYWLTHSISDEI